ncbi:MAG TPA: hypothetical protein VLL08_09570 [Kineosporiaceae bacterium]|nr:hypothetical protein [Kineosporiaceae bacterium]
MNLLLEGDDLEALLLRAHQEGGATARIVRAQKVRRGGILGFFAKEGFEVAVEIPREGESEPQVVEPLQRSVVEAIASTFPAMPQLTAAPPVAAIEAGSLLDLVDRASAAELMATMAVTRPPADGDPALALGSSPAERLAAKLMPDPVVTTGRFEVEDVDFPFAEIVEIAHEALDEAPHRADSARTPGVVSAVSFTAIEFPQVKFPADRPWPALVGLGPPAAASTSPAQPDPPAQPEQPEPPAQPGAPEIAAAIEPSSLNEARPRTDLFQVIHPSVAGDEPGADLEPVPDSRLWFDTPAAAPRAPVLTVITSVPASTSAANHPETEAAFAIETPAEPESDPVTAVQPPAEPRRFDQDLPPIAPSLEPSMSGGLPLKGTRHTPERPVIMKGVPTNGRATTVVPNPKPRRGGHRALPVPRPAVGPEPIVPPLPDPVEQELPAPAHRPVGLHDDRRPPEPTAPEPGSRAAESARHASELRHDPDDVRTDTPINAESSWKLLRRWRPGLRKQPAQDDVEHVDAPTEVGPDEVGTPFADAATRADVPAGPDLIDGFDQLTADREALRALGVPAAWTEQLHAGDRFGSIVAMLGQLPEPRIREDAAVIAVVGPADVVELEAHRTALELPTSGRPRAVTLVPGAVGVDRRAAIARSKRIRPVVISVPIDGYDDPAGTRTILDNIKAEAVIVVVDASRPLAEITAWVQALEQVDAIALDGALDLHSPAAVLGLDVPVIRVDGITVDRIGWAALLCAQLAALDASR